MNIQKYILPEWKSSINNSNLPSDLQDEYMKVGMSMAEFLDRKMMRKLPENWFNEWIRYNFPLSVPASVIEFHRIIGSEFSDFVSDSRLGKNGEIVIEDEEISKLNNLKSKQVEIEKAQNEKIDKIREEMSALRKTRNGGTKRRKTATKQVSKPEKPKAKLIDHEQIYEAWMEMVNQKTISKSYWHIHEYMARYILDFAKEHNPETGQLTKELVEMFLEEYGRGKRPKTMNHYNRVARYFWEFYDEMTNPSK